MEKSSLQNDISFYGFVLTLICLIVNIQQVIETRGINSVYFQDISQVIPVKVCQMALFSTM